MFSLKHEANVSCDIPPACSSSTAPVLCAQSKLQSQNSTGSFPPGRLLLSSSRIMRGGGEARERTRLSVSLQS